MYSAIYFVVQNRSSSFLTVQTCRKAQKDANKKNKCIDWCS